MIYHFMVLLAPDRISDSTTQGVVMLYNALILLVFVSIGLVTAHRYLPDIVLRHVNDLTKALHYEPFTRLLPGWRVDSGYCPVCLSVPHAKFAVYRRLSLEVRSGTSTASIEKVWGKQVGTANGRTMKFKNPWSVTLFMVLFDWFGFWRNLNLAKTAWTVHHPAKGQQHRMVTPLLSWRGFTIYKQAPVDQIVSRRYTIWVWILLLLSLASILSSKLRSFLVLALL